MKVSHLAALRSQPFCGHCSPERFRVRDHGNCGPLPFPVAGKRFAAAQAKIRVCRAHCTRRLKRRCGAPQEIAAVNQIIGAHRSCEFPAASNVHEPVSFSAATTFLESLPALANAWIVAAGRLLGYVGQLLLLAQSHDVSGRTPMPQLLGHRSHVRSDMVEEELVPLTEIVQTVLTIRRSQKRCFGHSPLQAKRTSHRGSSEEECRVCPAQIVAAGRSSPMPPAGSASDFRACSPDRRSDRRNRGRRCARRPSLRRKLPERRRSWAPCRANSPTRRRRAAQTGFCRMSGERPRTTVSGPYRRIAVRQFKLGEKQAGQSAQWQEIGSLAFSAGFWRLRLQDSRR